MSSVTRLHALQNDHAMGQAPGPLRLCNTAHLSAQ